MRPLVILPGDRPCAPADPVPPPGMHMGARPKGYCRPLPPARRKPRSVLWRRMRLGVAFVALLSAGGAVGYLWLKTDWLQRARAEAQALIGMAGALVDMRVGEIALSGRQHTPVEALQAAIEVERGDPILSIDLDALRKRVEALGWVKYATVWRQLPDTLFIEIEEREPFARWQIDHQVRLIDRSGRVLDDDDRADFASLLRLVGPGASDKAAALISMLETDPVLGKRVVNAIRVRERRWDIEFDNGVIVKLPENNPETAWARLLDLERRFGLLRRDLESIDLRLDDRLIVKLAPEAEPPAAGPGAKKPAAKRT
ncbi:cell division protein FtsQ/DivIB [Ferrovibrio sp.]|uniref:cell division protein FtsQ/DivIB n=1 Tax=Ferrovibrio sp. TaxID=1917215 RepID=UPI0025BE3000|nr:cell division protein FtsQ/DivIB [Ferrovibrio sp.]MBX3455778.1 FtsQ-type POTRA domain-containing protein [Ferrovibrio sp.]